MNEELTQLAAIAAGDDRAFARWAAAAEYSLRSSLRSFATRVDTEAVVQETLLRIWQVAPRFTHDGRPHALLRFAVRTGRNVAVSECRRRAVQPPPEEALEVEVAPVTPDPHLRERVRACHKKLPATPRLVLELRLNSAGGEDDTSLAEKARMSLNTFLQNFTRARKFLRECLTKAGINLEGELT